MRNFSINHCYSIFSIFYYAPRPRARLLSVKFLRSGNGVGDKMRPSVSKKSQTSAKHRSFVHQSLSDKFPFEKQNEDTIIKISQLSSISSVDIRAKINPAFVSIKNSLILNVYFRCFYFRPRKLWSPPSGRY